MVVSRKVSQVEVSAGSPWRVANAGTLLEAASIEVVMKNKGIDRIPLSVPCEYYIAAMRAVSNRIAPQVCQIRFDQGQKLE